MKPEKNAVDNSIGWGTRRLVGTRAERKINLHSKNSVVESISIRYMFIVGSVKWCRRLRAAPLPLVQSVFSLPHVLHDLNLNCFSLGLNVSLVAFLKFLFVQLWRCCCTFVCARSFWVLMSKCSTHGTQSMIFFSLSLQPNVHAIVHSMCLAHEWPTIWVPPDHFRSRPEFVCAPKRPLGFNGVHYNLNIPLVDYEFCDLRSQFCIIVVCINITVECVVVLAPRWSEHSNSRQTTSRWGKPVGWKGIQMATEKKKEKNRLLLQIVQQHQHRI